MPRHCLGDLKEICFPSTICWSSRGTVPQYWLSHRTTICLEYLCLLHGSAAVVSAAVIGAVMIVFHNGTALVVLHTGQWWLSFTQDNLNVFQTGQLCLSFTRATLIVFQTGQLWLSSPRKLWWSSTGDNLGCL